MSDFEQEPAYDLEAEQAVLGALMLSRDAIGDVTEILQGGAAFYRPAHETIYRTIVDLDGRGEPVDPIAVGNELDKLGQLERVGGRASLHGLVASTPSAASASYYAEIVRELGVLRRLRETGIRIAQMVDQREGDLSEILDRAGAELHAVVDEHGAEDGTLIGDDLGACVDELEALQRDQGKPSGVPTGFTDLDSLTGGLQPGQVIIVAARPAMGKSTLAIDFARSAAIKNGLPTVVFSMEMGRRELQHRVLSAQARVALHHMRFGNMTDEDWTRLARMTPRVQEAPLHIDATPGQTLMQIRARCRRIQQRDGLALVVIDYLQLMQSGGRQENRQTEVAAISRNLKLLAKELGVPVVVLSQLNRGPEQRTDKKPVLSDLRESGAIEQDADVVILLHREDAYEKESPRAGEADLIVAKHRNGPTATITVAAQLHYSRFVDMAQT